MPLSQLSLPPHLWKRWNLGLFLLPVAFPQRRSLHNSCILVLLLSCSVLYAWLAHLPAYYIYLHYAVLGSRLNDCRSLFWLSYPFHREDRSRRERGREIERFIAVIASLLYILATAPLSYFLASYQQLHQQWICGGIFNQDWCKLQPTAKLAPFSGRLSTYIVYNSGNSAVP